MSSRFVLGNPQTWGSALLQDHYHSARSARTVASEIARLAVHGSVPDSEWRITLESGLLRDIFEVLCTGSLCGFNADELKVNAREEYHKEVILPYLIDLLTILAEALRYLQEYCQHSRHPGSLRLCSDCARVEGILEPMKGQYTNFLDTLWDVSDVILVHESGIVSPHELANGRFILTVENALLHCIIFFEKIYDRVPSDALRRDLRKGLYRGCHLLVQLWIYSDSTGVQHMSVMRLISALRKAQPEVYALTCYSTFVKEITDGGIDLQENVYNALLADLKLGEYMHEHGVFEALIKANAQLRTQDMVTLRSHTDKELVWYSLSAARRQLCLETLPLTAGWQRHHESCLSVICLYLSKLFGRADSKDLPYEAPELIVYASVYMFSAYLFVFSEWRDLNPAYRELLLLVGSALVGLKKVLIHHRSHPTSRTRQLLGPLPPSVKRFVLDSWQQTRDRWAQERIASHHLVLKNLNIAWGRIGDELKAVGVPSTHGFERDFEPLKRCARKACACSVFRPVHFLGACSGCRLVVYCNKRCQRLDWDSHKEVCFSA